jgi:hypothetical protein
MRTERTLGGLSMLVVGLLLLTPCHVHATAIADSTLAFSNLTITPAAGTFQLLGPWEVQAFVQVSNSLGELDPQFSNGIGGTVAADAAVTFANGHGEASAPSISPDLNVTASSNAHAHITDGIEAQAIVFSQGILFNSFMITGGVGDASVHFSVDLTGNLSVLTDPFGVKAETDTIFALEVDGTPVLFSFDHLLIGPNASDSLAFSRTLSETRILQFDTPYNLVIDNDPEADLVNAPEPGTLMLLLTGLGILAVYARKKKAATSHTDLWNT